MKIVIKILAAIALFCSTSAFAQIYGVQNFCPRTGTWNYGPPCSGGIVQQQQQVIVPVGIPQNAIRIPSGGAIPQGYCSWEGRAANVGAGALIGGIVGVLAGDNHRAAGKGAAVGALAGVFIPCQQLQQLQQVQQAQQAQQVVTVRQESVEIVVAQPATVRRQISFEGGDFHCPLIYNGKEVESAEVKDPETCTAWTAAKAKQKGWVRNN